MANLSKKKSTVIKAIVIFLAALAILTFFSNTIMNLTIPKVVAQRAQWGNLSFTNSATGTVDIENKTEVKGIDGREVLEVFVSNYESVSEGDVLFSLKPIEDSEELEALQDQLDDLIEQRDYDNRLPNNPPDYSSFIQSIEQARLSIVEAQTTLNNAQNRNSIITSANNTIAQNEAQLVASQAELDAATTTLEQYQSEIDELEAELEILQNRYDTFVAMGTPTPTPIGATPEVTPTTAPTEVPATPTSTPTPSAEPTVDPSVTPGEGGITTPTATPVATATPMPTATPTPTAIPTPHPLDPLLEQMAEIEAQIETAELASNNASIRLSEASSEYARISAIIDDANALILEAEAYPSVAEAQLALDAANSSLTAAQRAYEEQQIQDGIARDQLAQQRADRDEQIADLQEQIEELTESIDINEVRATADGYVFNLMVMKGDILTKDGVVLTIIPEVDAEYVTTFTFAADVANSMYIGMELPTDNYWVEGCIITSIKPDANDPRNSRVVKCKVVSDYMYLGETINVMVGRSNQNYENIVPSSAVNEDNTGTFVYVLEESQTPLGDKYIVRRVDVTVEATDGTRSAIAGENLENGAQIIVRSEEPLQTGDRVRLQDYSDDEEK